MRLDLENLPTDPALLHQIVRDMAHRVAHQDDELERLRQIIRQFQRAQFGRRSEQLSDDQLALGLEDLQADLGAAVARVETESGPIEDPAEAPPRRKPLPDHLPREKKILELDKDSCPCCGGALHLIGESVSEMLDWIPAQVRIVEIHRPKYGCRGCGKIHQAPAPPRAIGGGRATPALLAQILCAKYCDHTPLYRQSQIFARHGVDLERSTLADWVGGACWWLKPLQEKLCESVFASDHLFADDTVVPVLDPGRGRTKTGRMWVYARDDRRWAGPGPPAVVYLFAPDRKACRPASHLKDFTGVLQVDAYSGFARLSEDREIAKGSEILLAACWVHARRHFYDIAEDGSPIAKEALRRIAELYEIEKRLAGLSAAERLKVRTAESVPLLATLHTWFEQQLGRVPRRGKLAAAIRYALRRWSALTRFVDDGRIELDTNVVERAIRPVPLGRKNHLFAGSDGGGERWAMICSLIETCKLNGVEPYAYLRDVLERMVHGHPVNQLDALLPWNWKPYNNSAD
jgi:transposase